MSGKSLTGLGTVSRTLGLSTEPPLQTFPFHLRPTIELLHRFMMTRAVGVEVFQPHIQPNSLTCGLTVGCYLH